MTKHLILAAVCTLALAACSKGDEPDAAASESVAASAPAAATSESAASSAAAAAAPASGDKPTKEFVVGKWGNDGDCSLAIDLKADGTSDGPFGKWTYADGVISFPEAPEMKINVTVDGKNMKSVNAQGGKHEMTRCP
jgi:hypothetical protein